MKTILRLAVVTCVGTAALAFASNALATQRLAVTQTATGVTIKVSQDQSDPQPAKITAYVPAGYAVKPTGAPGATIGTATLDAGWVFALIVAAGTVPGGVVALQMGSTSTTCRLRSAPRPSALSRTTSSSIINS